MALTALAIKHLKPRDKAYTIADGGGLCLEVSPAGGKHWRLRYRYNGKQQAVSLGKWPTVSLEEARKRREENKAILEAGKHPGREKKAAKLRQAVEGENTFERIARNWMRHKSQNLNTKYATQTLARMEQHVFPMIGALPIAEITIPDVVRVVEKIGERGTIETAHRMKQNIGQVFRYAAQRGLCQFNPAADMRDVLPNAPERHHPCIKPDELPELLRAMANYKGDPMTIRAMRLNMLTVTRTQELIGAKWEEINFDKAEWNIPPGRMKMRRPHVIPLSKQALALLREQQAVSGEKPFIFYNQASKSKHMSNGAMLMAMRRMGFQGRMTPHGFRSLASTILNERGYNPDVIERQLAHEDADRIRAAYNRAEYLLERKKMMQDYANLVENARERDSSIVTSLNLHQRSAR